MSTITMDEVSCRIDSLAAIAELTSERLGAELCAMRGDMDANAAVVFTASVDRLYYPILDGISSELFSLKKEVAAAL